MLIKPNKLIAFTGTELQIIFIKKLLLLNI